MVDFKINNICIDFIKWKILNSFMTILKLTMLIKTSFEPMAKVSIRNDDKMKYEKLKNWNND